MQVESISEADSFNYSPPWGSVHVLQVIFQVAESRLRPDGEEAHLTFYASADSVRTNEFVS